MTTARYTDITLLNGRKVPVRSNRRRLLDQLSRACREGLPVGVDLILKLEKEGVSAEEVHAKLAARQAKRDEVQRNLLLRFDPAAEFLAKKPVEESERARRSKAHASAAVRAIFGEPRTDVPKVRKLSCRALLVTEPGYVAALEDVLALVRNELTRQGAPQAPPIEQGTSAEACADCQKMAKECVDRIQYKLDELRSENSDLRKIIRYRESTIRSLKATASRRIERTKQVDRDMTAAHKAEIAGYRAHIDRLRLALAAHPQGVQE